MTARNFFHVGILVPDIEEGMERFSDALNLDFVEPADNHVEHFEQGGKTQPVDLRITWAKQGPPYVELLEVVGDGLYGPKNTGMHNVGIYDPDCEGLMKELVGKGLRQEATQYTPSGAILATYTAPAELYGTRLEFIDAGRKPGMDAWLSGGEWMG